MWLLLLVVPLVLLLGTPVCAEQPIRQLLLIEPTEEYPRHSEGAITTFKDGTLCLVYTRFRGGASDASDADLVMQKSSDGGTTWSDDQVLVPNEGAENTMSVSILRLPGGKLLLFYLRKDSWNDCILYVRHSFDEFQTLSEPVRVIAESGYFVVNNDRIARLTSGRILVPAALHPTPGGVWSREAEYGILRVFYSDDDGVTWKSDTRVEPMPEGTKVMFQEPAVLETKDGIVRMWIRTDAGSQYECTSKDFGIHWSQPHPGVLKSPKSPASFARVPWTGQLMCVWNDHGGSHPFVTGKRTPLCVALSDDEGQSWQKSRIIEDHPQGHYCYTSITFTQQDAIISYMYGPNTNKGIGLKVTALDREWLTTR